MYSNNLHRERERFFLLPPLLLVKCSERCLAAIRTVRYVCLFTSTRNGRLDCEDSDSCFNRCAFAMCFMCFELHIYIILTRIDVLEFPQ